MTIPGIGYTIAAIILAEIGDINNFSSPVQSGKYNASKTPMVKRYPHICVGL
jgi:transposase